MGGFLGYLHVNFFSSCAVILSLFSGISFSSDTLNSTQSLGINQTLVSSNQVFELGFFNSTSSSRGYLGIWYKNIPERTIVWVANRDTPLENSNATLKIGDRANLVLLDPAGNSLWSSNQSESAPSNPVLKLLDSGNLVIKEASETDDSDNFPWQSFGFPTDTLLPGMKLGWDFGKGIEWRITSWKSENDPSSGDYSFRMERQGIPEAFLYDKGDKTFRTGPWNGIRFGGLPVLTSEAVVQDTLVQNSDEVYYTPSSVLTGNQSVLTRLVINWTGDVQRFVRAQGSQSWNMIWSAPQDRCDKYFQCGPYGICDSNSFPVCKCFQSFSPKNQNEWNLRVFTDGCARSTGLDCPTDKFLQLQHVELPESVNAFVNNSMSLSECEDMCRKNCSCSAYANVNVINGGTGCVIWTEDPKDMRQFSEGGQDVFVRVAASVVTDPGSASGKKKNTGMIIGITMGAIIIVLGLIMFLLWKRKSNILKRRAEQIGGFGTSQDILLVSRNTENSGDTNMDDLELPLFDFNTITLATDNFSGANKLGEGGFGSVYRGRLFEGHDIAVKRLSKASGQGIEEFKNEVKLIVKLQHRNLVRMFGCCIENEEKMLVYEYMENKSLDFFLFDREKCSLLDWQLRFDIICGIARGLLYLHQDSRLRIIHRDLKASNILLDKEMNPKISDFGMARIFGNDQTVAKTIRVVGTYGYMSPEYALDGLFSIKSDVFSFGVLVLEIISGKKNRGFYYSDELNLLGHSWKLWNEGRALELVDPSFGNSYSSSEALRCIKVGLICVQERPEDRPTMSSVVLMLSSENASIPQPKNPGFVARTHTDTSSSTQQEESYSVNQVTVTVVDAR
ncbi:receptor-like serine/threonine-protein kinase SD1-8 [Neltuma alba]|uniref:receptor-like serine/threonine-protein kinase SD1-8 n=1 Tax=Neltuma alba TaxID=207710 RepID=UPI0010A56D27|nr:receptor-like serine/threonine-protein kinase SD1-8 [Prosopis alba]